MEELRISARTDGGGGYEFDVYDATELFRAATELFRKHECERAVELYDKLADEFPSSRYASAALYNAGLCLQNRGKLQEAVLRYSTLCERLPESPDGKDARFQLIEVLEMLERWDETLARSDELLAREDLSSEERLEAMARRAQVYLKAERLQEAERQARSALSYYRTRPSDEAIRNEYFAAMANFALADTIRLREQALSFPRGDVEAQRQVLIGRAELLLEAQREYFNTIHLQNAEWAAASGYSIGQMYDELWESIMSAPVPEHLPPEGHKPYRDELAKLIKPLVRHAIRYWELTLMLIERTGMGGEWTEKTRQDLDKARQRLLEQPPGLGGIDNAEGMKDTGGKDEAGEKEDPEGMEEAGSDGSSVREARGKRHEDGANIDKPLP